jgi:hypothetical protein
MRRDLRPTVGACLFGAYLAGVLFWVLRQPGGDAAARFAGLTHLLPALIAALVCWGLVSARFEISFLGRAGWVLLGAGALAFAASQGAFTYDRFSAAHPAAFPSVADALYFGALAFIPFFSRGCCCWRSP